MGEIDHVVLFDLTSKGLDISNDPDLFECFLNLPLPNVIENNLVDLKWIHTQQNIDIELVMKLLNAQTNISISLLIVISLCCALPNEDHLTQWKIASIKEMVVPLIKWSNIILVHPGYKRS